MLRIFLSISIMLAAGLTATAQNSSSKDRSHANAREQKLSIASDSTVQAQLQKTIDVKNAQVGDAVLLKTTQAIKQNGEVVISKGSTLIGRITEVKRRTREDATSRIGMIIDRVEGKHLAAPISASIVSITDTAAAASIGDTFATDMSGGSRTATSSNSGGSRTATSSNSGGLLGGTGGGLLGGASTTLGSVVNTTTGVAGGVTGTAGQTLGTTTGIAGRGLQGINLTGAANGSVNGASTLSTQNKNLRLEKGVTFNLIVNADASN